jgi:hypothetical protein
MQQVIAASEATVAQLQRNLQAFQNDPQAHQVAAATMQQAQAHLGTLHSQVVKLQQSLQQLGVAWDGSGQVTEIASMPVQQWLQQQLDAGSGKSRSGKRKPKAARASSSAAAGGDDEVPIVRSSRRAAAAPGSSIDDGIVRSPRRATRMPAAPAGTSQRSNSGASTRAAAAAASSGGSSSSKDSLLAASWQGLNGSAAAASGLQLNGVNGKHPHANGSSSSSSHVGSLFVPVQVRSSEGDDADV